MSKLSMLRSALLVGVLALSSAVADAQPPIATPVAGRRVDDVLSLLQQRGMRIIFSTQVVRSDMRVSVEPSGVTLRAVLDEVLQAHGLMVREGPGGTLLVVLNPRARARLPTAPRPAPGPPPLSVPTTNASEALRFAMSVQVNDGDLVPAVTGTPLVVRPLDVAALAGGFENVFRAVQALPGVVGTSELGSGIAVRGGSPDQNLTMMDGVEVHNPFRLMLAGDDLGMAGLASTFNAETLRRVELFPGAFDVRYGDRLSSLLIVEQRDGTEAADLQGAAFVGLTDANVILEGRWPWRNGSWLVSARRGFVDLIPERAFGTRLPTFHDVQARGIWRPRPGQQLTLVGSIGRERVRPVSAASRDSARTTRAASGLAALTYSATAGARLTTRTVLSSSHLTDHLAAFEHSFDNNRGANTAENIATGGIFAFEATRDADIRDLSVREELGIAISPDHLLEAGGDVHWLDTRWAWRVDGDRGLQQPNGSSIRLGWSLPDALVSSVPSTRTSVWLQDRWQVGSALTLQPGVRVDSSTLTGATTWSPRVSATWAIRPAWRIDTAFGLHSQTPGYEKTLQADYFVDLSRPGPPLHPERALHFVTGVQRAFAHGVTVRLDGYYKRFTDLVVGQLETETERQARLATYDIPNELWSSVAIGPVITVTPTNGGQGFARGLEVLVSRATSRQSRLSGWASYSFGRSDRTAYGVATPFDYDRRHGVSTVTTMRLGARLDLSVTGRWASGLPRTAVRGVQLAITVDRDDRDDDGNRSELIPLRDDAGHAQFQPDLGSIAAINRARLPAFGRLDARLTYRPRLGGERLTWHLDLLNLSNARNVSFIDSSLVFDPDRLKPRIVETPGERGLPFFPSVGVRIAF